MVLELVPWSNATKQDLIVLCNSVDRSFLSNRMPYPYTEADADEWLEVLGERDGKSGIYRAIVVNDRVVGNIAIEQKDDVYRQDAEIGYCLLTEYWGKGIVTECVRRMCVIAFSRLPIIRITALVNSENIGSRRVLEKNGFVLEGVQRKAITKNARFYDLCLYGKLKEEQ